MAKSTRHIDALGSFDAFKAPWQTEGGEDAEIDKSKLSRLIYNLKKDFAQARDTNEDTKETLTAAEAERDTFKEQAASNNGETAQKEIDKLSKKVDDLTAERDKLVSDKETADLRAEVLGDLDPKYAKYVHGDTKEELEESLAAVKEDFGIGEAAGDDDDNDADDEPVVRTTPRTRTPLRNPADRSNGRAGEAEIDFDKVAQDIVSSNIFG